MSRISFRSIMIVVTIAVIILLQFQVPYSHAADPLCSLQIAGINMPATAVLGQNVAITTRLIVTCNGTTQYILVRVDILESNSSLSESSLGLGTDNTPRSWNVSLLNSVRAPSSPGTWSLTAHAWVFASTFLVVDESKTFQIQLTQPETITTSSTQISSATISQTLSQTAQTSALETSALETPQATTVPTTQIGLAGVVVVLLAASVLLGKRRKHVAPVSGEREVKTRIDETPISQFSLGESISTGYNELDSILGGGLPEGYSVLILSEPYDEMDLLIRKLIQSTISQGYSVFFVSRDIIKTQDLISRHPTNLYAFNPMADKMPGSANIFQISDVQNLSDLNISFTKVMEPLLKEKSKRLLILDIISDALLEHKGLTTRRWLNDFIIKRKAEGFTILGIFNPNIAWKADVTAVVDLFDGVIEVFEKGLREKGRRFLIIKRMYGRKYTENEIMLDKGKF